MKFCEGSTIIFTGCRVASSEFPEELAKLTRSTIIAANGSSFPKQGNPPGDQTGEWMSGVNLWEEQQAAKNGWYVGWLKYQYNPSTQQVTEKRLVRRPNKVMFMTYGRVGYGLNNLPSY
ncbi:hypothetical protein [Piscibacillus salipiscarius]|uniref:hypothetical protein n=1 Tax=Piscibacillus salipiscarius TaxID=299480 RepID=UPI0006D1075D|nr:hypothetical protein [Piscibacillus salipiscarius]